MLQQHAQTMTGCGGSGSTATTAAASKAATEAASSEEAKSEAAASTDGKTYKVGICQLVQHVALDAATQGFKDALTEALGDGAMIGYTGRCSLTKQQGCMTNTFPTSLSIALFHYSRFRSCKRNPVSRQHRQESETLLELPLPSMVAPGIDGFDGL